MKKNCIIAQSGGPTAVINASAAGIIIESFRSPCIDKVYAAKNGILGVLNEDFFEILPSHYKEIKRLKTTPSSAFGSCRYRLEHFEENDSDYKKIFDFFEKQNIGYFFYIGGNDSMDTVNNLTQYAKKHNIDVCILGVPKTIDNDLVLTDHCPGYGSAAKYIATSLLEINRDALVYSNNQITIVEVMGRNAGWLAAAGALATQNKVGVVDFIYLPEVSFCDQTFLKDVRKKLEEKGNVLIVVSEGIKDNNGNYLAALEGSENDLFGHSQLGGVGNYLKNLLLQNNFERVKNIEFSILQRCASHCLSQTDVEESYQAGKEAVEYAEDGKTGYMVGFNRVNNDPYLIRTKLYPIDEIANHEKQIPLEWITTEQNYVTQECIDYMRPLIYGESLPEYINGIPVFSSLGDFV